MKKIKTILLAISLALTNLGSISVLAEEVEPQAEVLCDYYGSQHRLFIKGGAQVYDETTGECLVPASENWFYYECYCGTVVVCSGAPHYGSENSIGYYYETWIGDCYGPNTGAWYICYVGHDVRYSSANSIRSAGYYFYEAAGMRDLDVVKEES